VPRAVQTKADGAPTVENRGASAEQSPPGSSGGGRWEAVRPLWSYVVRHLILIPRLSGAASRRRAAVQLAGRWQAPATSDVSPSSGTSGGKHQLSICRPFFTTFMAAPVGTTWHQHTDAAGGWITAPIRHCTGRSASFTLLTIVKPGLLCSPCTGASYGSTSQAPSFAGASSAWHPCALARTVILNIARHDLPGLDHPRPLSGSGAPDGVGCPFSSRRWAVDSDQPGKHVVALLLAIVILFLACRRGHQETDERSAGDKPLGLGALIGFVIALPELIAMLQQIIAPGPNPPIGQLALNYAQFGVSLPTLSHPRLAWRTRLGQLASSYSYHNS